MIISLSISWSLRTVKYYIWQEKGNGALMDNAVCSNDFTSFNLLT